MARGAAGAIGSYQIGRLPAAGSGTSLATTVILVASAGTFTETGEAAAFSITVPETSASFALTGAPATLSAKLAPAAGLFAETGEASTFGLAAAETAGAFTLTGFEVAGAFGGIVAASGSFSLTGEAATFADQFTVGGQTVILTGNSAIELLSIGWRRAMDATTQWLPATKPASNWTVEAPPVSSWSREP